METKKDEARALIESSTIKVDGVHRGEIQSEKKTFTLRETKTMYKAIDGIAENMSILRNEIIRLDKENKNLRIALSKFVYVEL